MKKKKSTKSAGQRDHRAHQRILGVTQDAYDEMQSSCPRAAVAFVELGRAVSALGQHTPGWSGSLGSLTKPALGGLH